LGELWWTWWGLLLDLDTRNVLARQDRLGCSFWSALEGIVVGKIATCVSLRQSVYYTVMYSTLGPLLLLGGRRCEHHGQRWFVLVRGRQLWRWFV
jgi:hypothetical protein